MKIPLHQKIYKKLLKDSSLSKENFTYLEDLIEKLNEDYNTNKDSYKINLDRLRLISSLDWKKKGRPILQLSKIKETLNKSHYGINDVKDAILEYAAVLKLSNEKSRTPILLLIGPPGSGKTSIAVSIAKSLKRPLQKIFLGGLRDPHMLVGNRRVWAESSPGIIIESYRKAKSNQPIILLDEIDKIEEKASYTLLNILDYEQNDKFRDYYLEMAYDLSDSLFIATANSLDPIHPALLDRMEIIELSSYTEEEKYHITRKHIIPKVRFNTGLNIDRFRLNKKAIMYIITNYCREAGVRQLEKRINKIARKVAKQVAERRSYAKNKSISVKSIKKYLGPPGVDIDKEISDPIPGSAVGLAWTGDGGSLLPVETAKCNSKRQKVTITGSMGKVANETVNVILSFMKSHHYVLKLVLEDLQKCDIHVHYPDASTPKEGPSAGTPTLVALYSLFTNQVVDFGTATTGEINLKGEVRAIGGLKEKLFAAMRYNKTRVIIPEENEPEIEFMPDSVKENLEIVSVNNVFDLLKEFNLWKKE